MNLKFGSFTFILITSLTAHAEEPISKNLGITFKNANSLQIRKLVSESIMIYGGLGLGYGDGSDSSTFSTNTSSSTNNSKYYQGTIGARKYLNNDKLLKFINIDIIRTYVTSSYSSTSTSYNLNADQQSRNTSVNIIYGIEYFISPSVSIEGGAGIGLFWSEYSNSSESYGVNRGISFPLTNFAMTYYW